MRDIKKEIGLLGNRRGIVKPWWLPFDWVFCMVLRNGITKVRIVKNSSVRNVYALPVELLNNVVVGLLEVDGVFCKCKTQDWSKGNYRCFVCGLTQHPATKA